MGNTEAQLIIIADIMWNELEKTDIRFEPPLEFKLAGDTPIFICKGVACDPHMQIWIMDNKSNWSRLTTALLYAGIIAAVIEAKLYELINKKPTDYGKDTRVI